MKPIIYQWFFSFHDCNFKKHWRGSSSTPFLSILFLNFGNCCRLASPAEIKVHESKNYETSKERCKLCHINQTGQTARCKEACIKFIKYAEYRLRETFMKFIDSFDVWCLELYLINTFTKSTKVERCTDITHKLTLYCLSVTVGDLHLWQR